MNAVSDSSLWLRANHDFTYGKAFQLPSGGPFIETNINAVKFTADSLERIEEQTIFIWLNPRSHSAVLTGIVAMQFIIYFKSACRCQKCHLPHPFFCPIVSLWGLVSTPLTYRTEQRILTGGVFEQQVWHEIEAVPVSWGLIKAGVSWSGSRGRSPSSTLPWASWMLSSSPVAFLQQMSFDCEGDCCHPPRDLDLWPFELRVNACRGSTTDYTLPSLMLIVQTVLFLQHGATASGEWLNNVILA